MSWQPSYPSSSHNHTKPIQALNEWSFCFQATKHDDDFWNENLVLARLHRRSPSLAGPLGSVPGCWPTSSVSSLTLDPESGQFDPCRQPLVNPEKKVNWRFEIGYCILERPGLWSRGVYEAMNWSSHQGITVLQWPVGSLFGVCDSPAT